MKGDDKGGNEGIASKSNASRLTTESLPLSITVQIDSNEESVHGTEDD